MRVRSAVVAVSLLATACSGGPEPTSSSPATTTMPAPTTSPASTSPAFTTTTTTLPPVVLDLTDDLLFFAPVPPRPAGNDVPLPDGSDDYMRLFTHPEEWATTAERVDGFKIHSWMIRHYLTDDELRTIFTSLDKMGIALILEMEPLDPPDPAECDHTESFEGPYELDLLQRIKDLGADPKAIAIEQPHTFAVIFDGPGSCQYTLERTVDEVIEWVADARQVFPDIPVGSIEAVWSSPRTTAADFVAWLDTYEERSGEPFAFIHLDINWLRPDWAAVSAEIEAVADARSIPFGILYNGGTATTNDAWIQETMRRIAEYESGQGGTPQHVSIQSWVELPDQLLPVDDLSSFTHLIDRYDGQRVVLSDPEIADDTILGTATGPDGEPLEGLTVSVSQTSLSGAPQTVTITGTVPASATEGLIAIRANAEDASPGPADVRLYAAAYREEGGPDLVANGTFGSDLTGWGIYGDNPGAVQVIGSDTDDGRMMTVTASADQDTFIDGIPFGVTPGATYEFTATFGVPEASIDTASVAMIFLGEFEGGRATIQFRPQPVKVGQAITDGSGRYEVLGSVEPGPSMVQAETPGDLTTWPASATITVD